MSVTVVIGAQFGSEGKGAVTGMLARDGDWAWTVRVGGPNAGHTVYDSDGRRWALRQMPVAAVTNPTVKLGIAAGSEIDLQVLQRELTELEDAGHRVLHRLFIDQSATLLEPQHAEVEASMREGKTTGKGIGAARAARALRQARLAVELAGYEIPGYPNALDPGDLQYVLRDVNRSGGRILIEGTQGHGLGSHAGWYPDCTSGDCRAIDAIAACGLAAQRVDTWLVARLHPIRIAGDSGPLRHETSWEHVGVEPEITTVTKKVRRVGEWDPALIKAAVEANSGPGALIRIALMHIDYRWHDLAGQDGGTELHGRSRLSISLRNFIDDIEEVVGGTARVAYLGTGPNSGIHIQ